MALAVVSLLLISLLILNISPAEDLVLFVFFGTISSYNYLKYGPKMYNFGKGRTQDRNSIAVLSLIATLFACFYIYSLPEEVWPLLGFVFILLLLYMVPVFPRDKSLRSLGIVKVILVSICWTAVTLLLPVLYAHRIVDWDIWILSFQRFFLLLVLIIPFEIRDMHFDPPGIRTIPRRLGIKMTKGLGVFLALLSLLLSFFRDEVIMAEIYSRLAMTLLLVLLIARTPEHRSKYYAAFGVEALPIIWFGILYWVISSV